MRWNIDWIQERKQRRIFWLKDLLKRKECSLRWVRFESHSLWLTLDILVWKAQNPAYSLKNCACERKRRPIGRASVLSHAIRESRKQFCFWEISWENFKSKSSSDDKRPEMEWELNVMKVTSNNNDSFIPDSLSGWRMSWFNCCNA